MAKEHRRILNDAFGESSDGSSSENEHHEGFYEVHVNENPNWEEIKQINGFWLCRDFLSSAEQSSLLLAIQNEGWFSEVSQNQAMRFGDLPSWANELSTSIREAVCCSEIVSMHVDMDLCSRNSEGACLMPSNLLWREPLFDQLIANVYQPGEGICAHVDLMRFEDGIAIVSLESSCVMHFSREKVDEKEKETKIPVLLTPGSLVVMFGEARYAWKHEINRKPGFQMWEGQEIVQRKRTSVTLRKLCSSE